MTSYSLDDLRSELDKQFAPMTLDVNGEEFKLRNVFRMDTGDRKKIIEHINTLRAGTADEGRNTDLDAMVASIEKLVLDVTADGKGKKLVKILGGDLTLLTKVMNLWIVETNLGEAPSSPNS